VQGQLSGHFAEAPGLGEARRPTMTGGTNDDISLSPIVDCALRPQ